MKNMIIAILVAIIAVGGTQGAFAATRTVETTANVEVRVWRNVADPERLHLSTRPAGGRWTTHNDRLDMSDLHSSGSWYQSNFVNVAVPVSVEIETPPSEPGESTPTPTTESTNTLGSWEHFLTGNVAGDLEGYAVSGDNSYLYVRCTDNTHLDVFLSAPGEFTEEGEFTYRFSEGDSGSEAVTITRTGGSFGSTVSVVFLSMDFVDKLGSVAGGSLYIQLDGGSSRFSGSFVIDGIDRVREVLPCWD